MKQHSKNSLFLMELILSILFFSVCGALCVQLFVHAYQAEQKARDLTKAAFLCDSMAAVIQSTKEPDSLTDFFPELPVFYDSSWEPCDEGNAAWQLTLTLTDPVQTSGRPAVRQAVICVYDRKGSPSGANSEMNLFYDLHVGY